MHTASIEEVQANLPDLLREVSTGTEVLIVSQGKPVGRLIAPPAPTGVPMLGRGKGKLISYVEDKEHLKDFESYMP